MREAGGVTESNGYATAPQRQFMALGLLRQEIPLRDRILDQSLGDLPQLRRSLADGAVALGHLRSTNAVFEPRATVRVVVVHQWHQSIERRGKLRIRGLSGLEFLSESAEFPPLI